MAEETDVMETDQAEEQSLLEMASQVDAARDAGDDEAADKITELPKPEPEKPAEPEPETPEQELKPAAEKPRDEQGRFTKEGEKPAEVQPEVKPDSEYAKAQKEQKRLGQKIANFEDEKKAVRAEAARIQQERQQFERERQQAAMQNLPRAQKDGFTAQDYYEFAQKCDKTGDYENAYKAMATANELVAYEQQYYAQQAQQQQEAMVIGAFQDNLAQVIKEDPDAAWESQSPTAKEMDNLLKTYPFLQFIPEGAKRTYEIAKLRLDNQELIGLRAEVEKLRGEITNRDKASQPLRGGPTKPGQPTKFEDMTEDEQEADLMRRSEQLDQGYG